MMSFLSFGNVKLYVLNQYFYLYIRRMNSSSLGGEIGECAFGSMKAAL